MPVAGSGERVDTSGRMEEVPHGQLAEGAWVVGLKGREPL